MTTEKSVAGWKIKTKQARDEITNNDGAGDSKTLGELRYRAQGILASVFGQIIIMHQTWYYFGNRNKAQYKE